MEFGVLGPLEVVAGGRPVEVRSPTHRVLLVALLLRANHMVGVQQLIEDVWAQTPLKPVGVGAGGDGLPVAGVGVAPGELPADIAGFTGRHAELAELERVLGEAEQGGPV